jgi:hypothetical protein
MLNRLINLVLALFGVCRVVGWQNIYRSGYYHRCGKPGMYDRHPGDLYPTRDAAERDVEPPEQYVTTVKVVWYEDKQPHVNCASSQPVPITESRRKLHRQPEGFYQDGVWNDPPPAVKSAPVAFMPGPFGPWR